MGGIAPPAFVLLLSPLAVPAVMAQSWAEPSPAISDPEAYAVDAAVLPRPVLDENHRGSIAIQIEAPGPEGCPQAALITDEWRAAVAAVSRATIVAGSENTSVVKSDRLESTETSLWASRWRESLPAVRQRVRVKTTRTYSGPNQKRRRRPNRCLRWRRKYADF